MQHIPDSRLITEMSIPGTHDSSTGERDMGLDSIFAFASKCQSYPIATQLMQGVRWFDIRLRLHKGDLYACHGMQLFPFTFDYILSAFESFLQAHPKEAVFIAIQRGDSEIGRSLDKLKLRQIKRILKIDYSDETFIDLLLWKYGKRIQINQDSLELKNYRGKVSVLWLNNLETNLIKSHTWNGDWSYQYSIKDGDVLEKAKRVRDDLQRTPAKGVFKRIMPTAQGSVCTWLPFIPCPRNFAKRISNLIRKDIVNAKSPGIYGFDFEEMYRIGAGNMYRTIIKFNKQNHA